MKKTIFFFTFIFVFAVLVAGAQDKIPDLSNGGEYKIPKLCLSGEDSEYKFKVGNNVYTLKLMSRIDLTTKYPGGSFGGLTKKLYGIWDIDASTVIIPGAWLITKDNYVVVITGSSSDISVNGQRFGTYGGPFSEAALVREVTQNTLDYYSNVFNSATATIIDSSGIKNVFKSATATIIDSSRINDVKVETLLGVDSSWGPEGPDLPCVKNLYLNSEGVKPKSVIAQSSTPSTVTLVEGITLLLLFEGQSYQLTFSQKGSDYQLYVKRLNPESGHIQDFKKEDVIAGKVFKVAFPRPDGKSEDLFLISFPKLKIPEDVKGYDIQTVTQVVENPQEGGKQPFVFLSPPVPQPFIINYRNIVPKWVKLKESEIITSETVDGRPLPVPRLDVYIIAQTVEKPKDKPVPSPGLTGAAKGAVSVSLPEDVGVKLSETDSNCKLNPECDDGTEYTIEFCSEAKCKYYLKKGWCKIHLAGYKHTEKNPANSCEICQSDTEPLKWTTIPNCAPGEQSDVNNDGSVNKEDVLFIKSSPQKVWTEKLNKDIKNLNSLIKAMIKNWAAAK